MKHQVSRTYEGKGGREVTSVEHRAGWDATFSAPKSVSPTALVGGDDRVREAHRESVRVALCEIEHYTQARIGNVHAPETTGKFAAATFEHDTARPVEGCAAPQLHTHAVIFNVTERETGRPVPCSPMSCMPRSMTARRSIGRNWLRACSSWAMKSSAAKMASRRSRATREYLEASSPRRQQVQDYKREQGIDGAASGQIAAHRTRDKKELQTPTEVQRAHQELAAQHGHQADRVVTEALERTQKVRQEQTYSPELKAQQAVTYARDHLFERQAVQDRRALYETALDRGMGEITHGQVRQEFERRRRTRWLSHPTTVLARRSIIALMAFQAFRLRYKSNWG